MEHPVLLEMRGISKAFPGVKALDNVNLTVRAGTVHALMGENGAGKSTLMKCLFGIYNKDSGDITLDGKPVDFKSSKEALENGVAMVHQELNQALTRTVQDNLWLGRYPKVGGIMVSERIMAARTKEIFDTLEVSVNPKAIMSTLPVSQRQMVEIAKAVSYDSKIIVFDEPTSSLTETEVEHLFRIIDMLKSKGCGIIYISHKMDEILRISDEVTIMRDGTWVATRPAGELTMDEIIRLMVGRELTNRFPPKTNTPGEVILDVSHISGKYTRLKDASFQLRKGEVLGIAGLDGSGRTEVLENLFGAMTREGGTITLHGKQIRNRTPRESIKNGFALLTEERRATGIFGIRDIRENTVISSLKDYLIGGICLSDKQMAEKTEWSINAMHIKTPSIPLFVEGGNIFLHPDNDSYVSLRGIVGNWRNISVSTSLNDNDDNVMFINRGNIEVTLPPDVPGHTIYFKRMSGGVRLTGGRILPAPGGKEMSSIDLDYASGFVKCMGNYWVMFYCG